MQRSGYLAPIASLVLLLSTFLWSRARSEPRPTLVEVTGLAASGRLVEAEKALDSFLKGDPRNPGANLLAAQLAMARAESETRSGIGSDPRPAELALAHLSRAEFSDPGPNAMARLWRGKAERYLGLLDEAEISWLEALRLDLTVPEAGWLLLQEYYLQGRPEEARSLALRLHAVEPDPRDRILLLLEPLRQDVMPPAPGSLVFWFEPIAKLHPSGFRANLCLGVALLRSSDMDRGLKILRSLCEAHPDRAEAWDAFLAGLDESGEVEELARAFDSLSPDQASAPWAYKYRARLAELNGDWSSAVENYRRALQESPSNDQLRYRLARNLRRIDETDEADRLDELRRDRKSLQEEARVLYESTLANHNPGVPRSPEIFEKIAEIRERMGFPEEARAWRSLDRTTPAVN